MTAPTNSRTEHERVQHARPARYWIVWIALLVGTVATYLMSRVHLPSPFHLLVALAIATAKSALVVLFFMHLWDHGGANRLVFATSIVFVALLIGLVVMDNASRFALANPGRGATLLLEPPGPDVSTPDGPPAPTRRLDLPPAAQPGHGVGLPAPEPGRQGRDPRLP
jgi:cytochrome c oxidase subunit 4